MQKEVNKGKILGELLESPKTTAELARELGYINREGIARYNIINKDLKNLEDSGYVKSERIKLDQKPGNIPTLYSIIFNFHNLKKMLEEYPYLIGNMQRNELALKSIYFEHSSLISSLFKYYCLEHASKKENLTNHFSLNNSYFYNYSSINSFLMNTSSEGECLEFFEDLKKKLESSPEFFKTFLMNDKSKLINNLGKLVIILSEQEYEEIFVEYDNLDNLTKRIIKAANVIDVLFRACIIIDIMKEQSNIEIEELVTKMGKKYQKNKSIIEKLPHNY